MSVDFQRLRPEWAEPLEELFISIIESGDERYFSPHPLTVEEARLRASCIGDDKYYILTELRTVLGYGMLRGWDEGYEIPSLGIVIHPLARGKGLGRFMMEGLHANARILNAVSIRLKVHHDNTKAVSLYESMGYIYTHEEKGQRVMTLDFKPK